MVNDPKRPVQIVFAGKAHPHDEPGKELLQQIAQTDARHRVRRQVRLRRGLRHQRRPPPRPGRRRLAQQPAPAARGLRHQRQKVVLNGGLNLSVLDGWWAEAYDGLNGFAIGAGRTHSNMDVHDSRDGEDLYRVLREELIPLYYQRDQDGLPRGWIKRMKRTIRTLGWRFNADRMVMDYTLKCYVPAAGGTSSEVKTLS